MDLFDIHQPSVFTGRHPRNLPQGCQKDKSLPKLCKRVSRKVHRSYPKAIEKRIGKGDLFCVDTTGKPLHNM